VDGGCKVEIEVIANNEERFWMGMLSGNLFVRADNEQRLWMEM
jgi:hypothetical protein